MSSPEVCVIGAAASEASVVWDKAGEAKWEKKENHGCHPKLLGGRAR